jgi:predicted TIM-barrel fold metal-dependent hydrolase
MRIDVHAHYWPDQYLDLLSGMGATDTDALRALGAGDSQAELATRLRLMDDAGVDVQILSVFPQVPHFADRGHAITAARTANDLFAEFVARNPNRFAAFAAMPLPHVDAAIDELSRALDDLGMVGAAITTALLGRSIGDPLLDALYAELDRRGSALYIHPSGCGAGSPLVKPYGLTWMIGAPIEDTIAAAHLITAGIPMRYPRMKIINSHLGGGLPMLVARMDAQYQWEAPSTPELPSRAAKRMWYDTVAHGHVPALRCACESFGADRLLLGTDFPYQSGAHFQNAIDYVVHADLDTRRKAEILDENATALFPSLRRGNDAALGH